MNMNGKSRGWASCAWALVLVLPACLVQAQQTAPPGKSNAQIEAGEPRADTSSTAAHEPSEAETGSAVAGHASPPTPVRATSAAPSQATQAGAHATSAATATSGSTTGIKSLKSADRLDLGTATVTGDREQPKVMYIVPWKQSDIGDLSGKPMNSLLDEALAPVDRDEFKREVAYYNAAKTPQNGALTPAARQGEK